MRISKKNDERIEIYKRTLGDDLEIIDDEGCVYLRRKSSCLVPVLCLYGIKEENFTDKEIDEHTIDFEFDFPEDMYKHFSVDQKSSVLFIQPAPFEKAIQTALSKHSIKYDIRFVKYIDKKKSVFFINPTDSRDELFYKTISDIYNQQQEVRIVLMSESVKNESKRKNIALGKMGDKDINLLDVRVKMRVRGKR